MGDDKLLKYKVNVTRIEVPKRGTSFLVIGYKLLCIGAVLGSMQLLLQATHPLDLVLEVSVELLHQRLVQRRESADKCL